MISNRDPRFAAHVFQELLKLLNICSNLTTAYHPQSDGAMEKGEEVYEVETILKHWRRGRGYQYYVKWTGYPITKATWESESAFSDDGNMLQIYKDRYQLWHKKDLFLLDNKD